MELLDTQNNTWWLFCDLKIFIIFKNIFEPHLIVLGGLISDQCEELLPVVLGDI